MGIHAAQGFTGNSRAYHIADTHHKGTFFLSGAEGCKCIGSFTRLGNKNYHIINTDNGIAIPEL